MAQNGFFGKKTVISIDGVLKGNVLYNMLLPKYDYMTGTSHTQTKNRLIGGGFNASISHYFTYSSGIGIDFNMAFNYVRTPMISNNSYIWDTIYGGYFPTSNTVEAMRMRTFYVMPKYEWKSNGNLPVGLVHSIGFGYAGSFIVDDAYKVYNTSAAGGSSSQSIRGSSIAPVHGLVVEYGVKLRIPITSFLSFDVGSHLRLHVPFPNQLSEVDGLSHSLVNEVRTSMRRSRGTYLVDIRAGLSFILF